MVIKKDAGKLRGHRHFHPATYLIHPALNQIVLTISLSGKYVTNISFDRLVAT